MGQFIFQSQQRHIHKRWRSLIKKKTGMRELKSIFTLSCILTIGNLYSQGLEIEFLGRPALTSLRGNKSVKDNFDPTTNFSTGLGVNYFIKNNSILNIAIIYDKKGGSGEMNIVLRDEQNQIVDEGKVTNKATFDYITIPIQWGQRFGQKIKYQFGIGLYTSFLLKHELTSEGLNGLVNSHEDNTDTFKKIDLGLSASFNVLIPITDSLSIKVGLDDNLGLINTSDVPVADDGTIKHNSLGLFVGINLRVN